MEAIPPASLNTGAGEELSLALVWPVSHVSRGDPWLLLTKRESATPGFLPTHSRRLIEPLLACSQVDDGKDS